MRGARSGLSFNSQSRVGRPAELVKSGASKTMFQFTVAREATGWADDLRAFSVRGFNSRSRVRRPAGISKANRTLKPFQFTVAREATGVRMIAKRRF